MSTKIDFSISELNSMKNYPENIYYKGDLNLLNRKKVSIVGSRKPNNYTKNFTYQISHELAKRGVVIVSGAAIGVDAIAHNSAGFKNTIAVMANGLNIKYPAINAKLIENIEKEGLTLSTYSDNEKARNYTFVHRNELVVALGEILIVTQADEKSGTLSSIDYALKMGKKVYTIPHHLNDSLGTQKLLEKKLIEPIYDLKKFFESFSKQPQKEETLFEYINSFPSYEQALKKYKNKIYELELEGLIKIENGFIKPL